MRNTFMLISKRGMFHTLYLLRADADASGRDNADRVFHVLVRASFWETIAPGRLLVPGRERFLLSNLPRGLGADPVEVPILTGDIKVTRLDAE
jgi:hypothetical protein